MKHTFLICVATLFLINYVYCQQNSCKITGIIPKIMEGDAFLIEPFSQDTLGKAKILNGSFELYTNKKTDYIGVGVLHMIQSDNKMKSNSIIFVEPRHIYFYSGNANTIGFAGTENQLLLNRAIQDIAELEKQPNTLSEDTIKKQITHVFNDFIRQTKSTLMQDFSLLLAAELLTKGKILPSFLMVNDSICQDTTPKMGAILFCEAYKEAQRPLIGTKIPNIILKNNKGEVVNFASIRDTTKYLVMNFWASWCSPCIEKFNETSAFFAQNTDKIQVMTVSIDEKIDKWTTKLEQLKLPYINLYDESQKIHKLLKGNSVPYTVVIDKNNQIIAINPKKISDFFE